MQKRTLRWIFACLMTASLTGLSHAAPATWSGNGHEYVVVLQDGASWDQARAGAESFGAGWDLATITSLAEQEFIDSLLGPADGSLIEYYIGGWYQGGTWQWVTGEDFTFTYWGSGEPNGNTTEPRLALDARYKAPSWGWNDYTGAGSSFIAGYVAERHTNNVPEPGSLALVAMALLGLAGLRKRVTRNDAAARDSGEA